MYNLLCLTENHFYHDNSFVLNNFFHNIDIADNQNSILELIQSKTYDVMILDINYVNLGIHTISFIKKFLPHIEVILISQNLTICDLLLAIDYKVVRFFKRPVKTNELYNAINLSLSEVQQQNNLRKILEKFKNQDIKSNNIYHLSENIIFDINKKSIFHKLHNKNIALTKIEVEILHLLLLKQGTLVDYNYLKQKIWNKKNISESTIRTAIYKIRNKLNNELSIKTIPKIGYILHIDINS